MFRNVLVPVDRSRFAEAAIPVGAAIARRSGGTLSFALVNTVVLPDGVRVTPVPMDATFDREMRREASEYLQQLVDRTATEHGLRAQFTLLDGPIAETLEKHAREIDADLMVLSTHGRGGVRRAWLGSVADRLIRHVDVPVLLVRPTEDAAPTAIPAFTNVVIGLDGSVLAESALRAATVVAGAGARCTAVRVAVPPLGPGSPYLPDSARLTRETVETERNRAAEYLGGVERRAGGDWSAFESLVVTSFHPAHALLEAARERSADLIVVATHGRTPVMRAVLGSVADKVIRGAELPVLVVPAHAVAAGMEAGHLEANEKNALTS